MDAASKQDVLTRNDPLLEPLIAATDDQVRSRHVETLVVELAGPLIRKIVARCARSDRQLREQDAEDVIATVTLRLVRKLRRLGSESETIRQFQDYVATLTYNTVYDFLRRRFPERSRLKNRLRYVLTRDPRLRLWEAPSGPAGGLAEWSGSAIVAQQIELPAGCTAREALNGSEPADAHVALFRQLGTPASLDALTDAAAELWGICDSGKPVADLPQTTEPSPLDRAENRQFLGVLWAEIRLLGSPHRTALLLNLRDGDGINAIQHFLLLGIARFDELAAAIGITIGELAKLWSELPLDDHAIAGMLGTTRQHVINYRKTARNRLARRMMRKP
jgi:DNA-directed RNA polymerase specialized sigma24 family protein